MALLLVPHGTRIAENPTAAAGQVTSPPALHDGQSATLLPDGRWLLIGGVINGQPSDTAEIWDASTGGSASRGQARPRLSLRPPRAALPASA
jgi:hypothetical protein